MIKLPFYMTATYIEYKGWKHHFDINVNFGNTKIPEINFVDDYEPTNRNAEFDITDIEDAAYEKMLIAFDDYLHKLGFDFFTDISIVKKKTSAMNNKFFPYGIPKTFIFYEKFITINGDMRQLTFFKMKYM